jgi:hypothetical protein
MAKKTMCMGDAIALFRMGKSLRECERQTGISFSSIKREAVRIGAIKGDLIQLTNSMVKDKIEIGTLDGTTAQHVLNEVDEIVKHTIFFNNATLKNCSIMMKKVGVDMEIVEHKMVQETLSKAKETVLGKTPETAVQINNTQQAAITSNGITKEGIASIHEALGIIG